VNVPHNDDWNYISQYQNFLAGKLNYFDLMTLQDSGYRQPTLRLFWYPLLALSHVDMQVILVGHVGLILACLMGVFLIYRSISPKINLLAFAPVALLMFGTGQSEGLLWAGTTPYFLANLGVVFALALIGRSQTKYFVLGLIAAVFANYSYGNGFLVWPLTALILLAGKPNKRRWLTWLFVAGISVGLYAINWVMFTAPGLFSHSPSLGEVFRRNPFDVFEFFFSTLGMSLNGKRWFGHVLSFQSVAHPAVMGVVLVCLFVGLVVYLAIRKDLRASALPIALFLFGLGNSVLLVLCRVGDGEAGAYTTRYVISTTLAAVGLYLMLVRASNHAGGFWRVTPFLCGALIVWLFITIKIPDANDFGQAWQIQRLAARANLQNFEKLNDAALVKAGSGYPADFLRASLGEMKRSHSGVFIP